MWGEPEGGLVGISGKNKIRATLQLAEKYIHKEIVEEQSEVGMGTRIRTTMNLKK